MLTITAINFLAPPGELGEEPLIGDHHRDEPDRLGLGVEATVRARRFGPRLAWNPGSIAAVRAGCHIGLTVPLHAIQAASFPEVTGYRARSGDETNIRQKSEGYLSERDS
jgi:hypothetical protein